MFRVNIRSGSRVFCISHRDDPDGLASAALVRCATHCRFALISYEDMEGALANVPHGLDWLVVTDLGLSERRETILQLPAMARHVLYVDHHLLSTKTKLLLRRMRINVCHSLKDCTSVLVWDLLRNRLPQGAVNLAAYGAVTDPAGSGGLTREVLLRTSWNLDAYEGHMLALALSSDRCTTSIRETIVRKLALLQLPHRINAVRSLAEQQARNMAKIQKQLRERAQVRGGVAIARAGRFALGTSAELLLGIPNVVATVVYDSQRLPSETRLSVRGTNECGRHLGRLMLKITGRLGGSGGGHELAAGGIVPNTRLKEFMRLFAKEIGPNRKRN